MVGIVIDNRKYVFDFMNFSFTPNTNILIFFNIFDNEVRSQQTYSFTLTGQDLKDFYDAWDNHRQVYVELCKQLGVDDSIVPEDMDDEINQ
jgi:hypothetical protein